MRVPGCSECLRLAAEYTGVTLAHFKLDAQYKLAALRKDEAAKLQELLRRLQTAEETRQKAKEKLHHHEEQAHQKR
jgi:hypothetical protein